LFSFSSIFFSFIFVSVYLSFILLGHNCLYRALFFLFVAVFVFFAVVFSANVAHYDGYVRSFVSVVVYSLPPWIHVHTRYMCVYLPIDRRGTFRYGVWIYWKFTVLYQRRKSGLI